MVARNAESMGLYGSSWQASGYCGSSPAGELLGSLRGLPAIIAGGAEGVFEEVTDALEKMSFPVIFAVNDVGMFLPTVDHWVSLHSDSLGAWKQVRWIKTHAKEKTLYHSVDARPFIDVAWEGLTPLFSLSGYFAMQLAWIMGASQIVLCGCPGSPSRRFFDLEQRKDFGYGNGEAGSDKGVREQIEREMTRLPDFRAVVRSQSGWTREYFGALKGGD